MYKSTLTPLAAMALMVSSSAVAADGSSPGLDAIREFREGLGRRPAIENRFFLKKGRFELAPIFTYVPNNPFARRYGGALDIGYHFSETLAAEAVIGYAPDLGLNDLKGLTAVLVAIARDSEDFQQPLDKVTLSAGFSARWAPVYGKINLVGETVINFDFYGVAGLGMISKVNYFGIYDGDVPEGQNPIALNPPTNEVEITPILGVGFDFFLTQSLSLKIDARTLLYVDEIPDYNAEPDENDGRQRLYSTVVTSVGIGVWFPKMDRRLYNF